MDFNLEPFVSSTIAQELTATLQSALTAFNSLPALTALDAVPKHPYDNLKYRLLGPDFAQYKFKNIDDVPLPEDFSYIEALNNILANNKYIHNTLAHNLTCEPHLRADLLTHTLSGNTIISDVEKQMKQIEFIEMIKQMDLNQINHEQALDYSKKIISEYLKMY